MFCEKQILFLVFPACGSASPWSILSVSLELAVRTYRNHWEHTLEETSEKSWEVANEKWPVYFSLCFIYRVVYQIIRRAS